jgi:hypothetical protein
MMTMDRPAMQYLHSLDASALGEADIEDIFRIIALFDNNQSPQPQTAKGKRVTVNFFLSLLKEYCDRQV